LPKIGQTFASFCNILFYSTLASGFTTVLEVDEYKCGGAWWLWPEKLGV